MSDPEYKTMSLIKAIRSGKLLQSNKEDLIELLDILDQRLIKLERTMQELILSRCQ